MSYNNNSFINSSPSLYQPLASVFPIPIVAKRAPTANDIKFPLGQLWIYSAGNSAYVLTSVLAGVANWENVSGGAGVFTSLTVNPGPTALSTVGNGAVTIGNAANTGAVTISVGTGNFSILGNAHSIAIGNDAAANTVTVGSPTVGATTTITSGSGTGVGTAALTLSSLAAGDIQIGGTTHTGAIYLGVSTAGDTVDIANAVNVGAQVVNIAAGASGANSTVNILSGNGTAGTQTANILTGTRAGDLNLGTGAAAHTIIIGHATAGNDITLASPVTYLPGPVQILTGAGAPAAGLAINVGDFYINTTAATAATRCYMATAAGTWTNFTMAG